MITAIYRIIQTMFSYTFIFFYFAPRINKNEEPEANPLARRQAPINVHQPPLNSPLDPDNHIFHITLLYLFTAFLSIYVILVDIFLFKNNHHKICGMILVLVFVLVPVGTIVYVVINNRHQPKLESLIPKFNIITHNFTSKIGNFRIILLSLFLFEIEIVRMS